MQQATHQDARLPQPICPKRWMQAKELEEILVEHGFEEGRRTAKNFRQWHKHDGVSLRRVSISAEQQRGGIPPAVLRCLWRDAGWVVTPKVRVVGRIEEEEAQAPCEPEPELTPSSPERPAQLAHDPLAEAVRLMVETMREQGATMVLVDLDAGLIRVRREDTQPLPGAGSHRCG